MTFALLFEQREYEIDGEFHQAEAANETLEAVAQEIIAHCEAANFAGKTLNYLNTLSKTTDIDKTSDKSLRGAYFEYYVFKMLSLLKRMERLMKSYGNGKIGKYGLPVQAPGGKKRYAGYRIYNR